MAGRKVHRLFSEHEPRSSRGWCRAAPAAARAVAKLRPVCSRSALLLGAGTLSAPYTMVFSARTLVQTLKVHVRLQASLSHLCLIYHFGNCFARSRSSQVVLAVHTTEGIAQGSATYSYSQEGE